MHSYISKSTLLPRALKTAGRMLVDRICGKWHVFVSCHSEKAPFRLKTLLWLVRMNLLLDMELFHHPPTGNSFSMVVEPGRSSCWVLYPPQTSIGIGLHPFGLHPLGSAFSTSITQISSRDGWVGKPNFKPYPIEVVA